MSSSTQDLYQQYVVAHGLEREALFELLQKAVCAAGRVVSWLLFACHAVVRFQHVVYVDRHALAGDFFEAADGARRTMPLPVADGSVDLVLALFAPGVSRACGRYLRPGGWLLTNDHANDAAEAARDPSLALVGVIDERRGVFSLRDARPPGTLERKPPGAARGRQVGGRTLYVRPANYYLFRRRRISYAAPSAWRPK